MSVEDTTLEAAENLVSALQNGDESAAASRVMSLVREFENGLYQEIGQLTRVVHEAVKGLCEDSGLTQITTAHIPDAKQRLDYVMERTAEATHRTLTSVESLMPLADEIVTDAKDLRGYWVQAVKDDTWESQSTWHGIGKEMVVIGEITDAVPEEVAAEALALRDSIASGEYHPFTGPLNRQDGTVFLADGEVAEDGPLLGMDFYVEGIDATIPN